MKGTCPQCGAIYYGWALANPTEQKCGRCESLLEINRVGVPINSVPYFKVGVYLAVSDLSNYEDMLRMKRQSYLNWN